MKKRALFHLFLFGLPALIVFGYILFKYDFGWEFPWITRSVSSEHSQNETSPQLLTSPSPQPALPVTLRIPKLGVTTTIEHVTLDDEGRMDVPANPDNVAWYALGPRVGEMGSAVIAGHLDEPDGPAVFYRLSELRNGDVIEVNTAENEVFTYVITETADYPDVEFPLQKVFERQDAKRLNLITCSGTFDKNDKRYSHRFVVYAVLREEKELR